jgi:hypothetical protein
MSRIVEIKNEERVHLGYLSSRDQVWEGLVGFGLLCLQRAGPTNTGTRTSNHPLQLRAIARWEARREKITGPSIAKAHSYAGGAKQKKLGPATRAKRKKERKILSASSPFTRVNSATSDSSSASLTKAKIV